MNFQIFFLNDLEDEFEDLEAEFIEAYSWLNALQIAEAKAIEKKKYLAELIRLE